MIDDGYLPASREKVIKSMVCCLHRNKKREIERE